MMPLPDLHQLVTGSEAAWFEIELTVATELIRSS
jgi:hypothetical protein